jgi:uncharacterized protein YodC (DUF2158 family)
MTAIKSGDLVVLKSGGPTMTVDSVNTSIFDDNKVTGIVCVWFVGDRLERVRFEPDAIEPVRVQKNPSRKKQARPEEASGEYKVVLDEMVTALNTPPDAERDGPGESDVPRKAVRQPRRGSAAEHQVASLPSGERH